MADKYINAVGLQTIKEWIVSKFTNKIETVKVNGTALTPDSEKAVNVETPTVVGEIARGVIRVNNPDGSHWFAIDTRNASAGFASVAVTSGSPASTSEVNLATKEYVDENGGKIDAIKLNNVTQPITNKTVDLNVVALDWESDRTKIMKAGGLSSAVNFIDDTNGVELMFGKGSAASQTYVYKVLVDKTYVDGTFRTEAQVQGAIDAALADITGIDFQVVTELPATGTKGVIYLVANAGTTPNTYDEYIWITPEGGTAHFEKIGTTDVDLSNYWTMTEGQANSLVAMTVAEINAILEA